MSRSAPDTRALVACVLIVCIGLAVAAIGLWDSWASRPERDKVPGEATEVGASEAERAADPAVGATSVAHEVRANEGSDKRETGSTSASRDVVRSGILVLDPKTKAGVRECDVDFVDDVGALIASAKTDGDGYVAAPEAEFGAVVAHKPGRNIVGAWSDESRIELGELRMLDVEVSAGAAGIDAFDLEFRIGKRRHQSGLGDIEAQYLRGDPRYSRWFASSGLRVRLPNPISSAGEVMCDGIHRPTGHRIRLGTAWFAPGATSLTMSLRSPFERHPGWVAVRVMLPRPGQDSFFSGSLNLSSGRSPFSSAQTNGKHSMLVVALGVEAEPAMLRVSGSIDSVHYAADNYPVALLQNEIVDVEPWRGGGSVDVEIVDAATNAAVDTSVRYSKSGDVDALVCSAEAQIAPGRFRVDCLPPGSYQFFSWSIDGYAVEKQHVEVEEGTVARVKLEAVRWAKLALGKPDDGKISVYARGAEQPTHTFEHFGEDSVEVPVGHYVVRFCDARGQEIEREVHVGKQGATVDFR